MNYYYFVDEDGTENVSNIYPTKKKEGFWTVEENVYDEHGKVKVIDRLTEIPKGTIKALFDVDLTFDDEPIHIEQ